MPFQFCPQCGTKLQPDFKFCPSCGERIPCPHDELVPVRMVTSLGFSPPEKDGTPVSKTSLALSPKHEPPKGKKLENCHWLCPTGQTCTTSGQVATGSPLRPARQSPRLAKVTFKTFAPPRVSSPANQDPIKDNSVGTCASPSERYRVAPVVDPVMEPTSDLPSSPGKKSPRATRGKSKLLRSPVKQERVDSPALLSTSPTLQISKSPFKGKNKAKKGKYMPAVAPLQDGEVLTDTTGKNWTPVKLLSQSTTELTYEVARTSAKEWKHILKLGAKDGKIFNEQNFLQRAAKPTSVEKWTKQNKMDFLGIPSCVGFGLHADSYRFLIFSEMGRSLQSVMEEEKTLLSETAVLQLACRILDVLHFIHTNEYVHADINAENIYIQQGDKSQVFLAGYCHAFRFCPGGKHVEYREHSKTPHEGAIEFTSLDMHKGAAPSRRSDLQSLAYCMLHWHTGTLPWSGFTQPDKIAAEKQRYIGDVPALLSDCFRKRKVSGALRMYVSAVMALEYTELPDYSALRDGLSHVLRQQGGSVEQPLNCCSR